MEDQINALCVSEIKRLTVLFKDNETQLVSLYKNYSNFSKMYDQFSGDETGTYSLLVSIIGLYISATNKLISSENIVKLYNELKGKYEEENKSMEA